MNLIKTDKAFLWPTHRPGPQWWGWQDYIEHQIGEPLWTIHRLDKETTGCQVFAKDKASAAEAEKEFRKNLVEKQYVFISKFKASSFHCEDPIGGKDAQTDFELISEADGLYLYKALPKSGRKHQIRIHAKACGMPLLGDKDYGIKDEWPHFFLHCHKMKIAGREYESPLPYYFQNLKLFSQAKVVQALQHIHARRFLFSPDTNAYCLLHKEVGDLRIEILGEQIIYEIYEERAWHAELIRSLHQEIENLFDQQFPYIIQYMNNRGQDPHKLAIEYFAGAKQVWKIQEHGALYEMRAEQGKSYGLFLDQRKRRWSFAKKAKGKDVLNLFCYTGGFSVLAAKMGAKAITNVDTSQNTLDWLKQNLELNDIPTEKWEYWSSDARIFIRGAIKKQRKYDLIVCDPPSFARSKNKSFQIKKEWRQLIQDCQRLLKPGGSLYFSMNYEALTWKSFRQQVEEIAPGAEFQRSSWDFEAPTKNTNLKAFTWSAPL